MGIRFGCLRQGSQEIEWSYVSHCECDGIGAFVRLLRGRGVTLDTLPTTNVPCRAVITPLWNLWKNRQIPDDCAQRNDWHFDKHPHSGPSEAVAWHLFSEAETTNIVRRCRRLQVSVNSFLLKQLDQAVRPDIRRPDARIPWMVPVNLRGDFHLADDTENHVSCVDVLIASNDSPQAIHQQIQQRLQRGEHRANYLLLGVGKLLSLGFKVKLLSRNRSKPNGNIGAFSNLGVWDSEKKAPNDHSWLFCPPVVDGQLLGAGCVTFQNRLALTVQAHPSQSRKPEMAACWMTRWVEFIGSEGAVVSPDLDC